MIREDRFVMSHKQYAIDLGSLDTSDPDRPTMRAVWYRRRRGVTMACIGDLWDAQDSVPESAAEFLDRHDDGRHGGDCQGRWDGERYWGAQRPEVIEEHLALLRSMLDNCPTAPDGYDGWWRF